MFTFAAEMNRQVKRIGVTWLLLWICMATAAQEHHKHHYNHEHPSDSTDVFYRHLKLNEMVVTGVTGDTKLKNSTAPIAIVSGKVLRQKTSTNVIGGNPEGTSLADVWQ